MAENSKIEWCDHTFNPWTGWGKGVPRKRTSEANWRLPLKWNREAERQYMRLAHTTGAGEPIPNRRPRLFCASLSDWLDDEVPVEWLADLLDLIWRTPNLDWLLCTQYPENWAERTLAAAVFSLRRGNEESAQWSQNWANGTPPENVWIGTNVKNQDMADKRIPELLAIPARVRFLSCEPLLSAVDLRLGQSEGIPTDESPFRERQHLLHWVIAGGESGPGARPMHPDWARSLRDQCRQAGVPFLLKQWGEWLPWTEWTEALSAKYPDFSCPFENMLWTGRGWFYADGREECNDAPEHSVCRVGRSRAGRLLDGREHNEFPFPAPVSSCCAAAVRVDTADEGTSCHMCCRCGKPCDAKEVRHA